MGVFDIFFDLIINVKERYGQARTIMGNKPDRLEDL
jgi:hypothetical protein